MPPPHSENASYKTDRELKALLPDRLLLNRQVYQAGRYKGPNPLRVGRSLSHYTLLKFQYTGSKPRRRSEVGYRGTMTSRARIARVMPTYMTRRSRAKTSSRPS